MYWAIFPMAEANGANLFLTDNSFGSFGSSQVTVTTQENNGTFIDAQLWIPIFVAPANGFVLLNKSTKNLLQYNGLGGSQATLVPDTSKHETDTTGSTCVLNLGGNHNNYFAIRPMSDFNQNLNVSGSGPYSSGNGVMFFHWGGGRQNEQWSFLYVSP